VGERKMLREGEALPGGSYRVRSRRVHWRSQRKNLRLQQHDEDVTPPSNTCRNQLHSASAGTPAPNEERHMPKRGRRRSRGVFEPLRRGLRNRSFPLEPAITTTSAALLKHWRLATTEIRNADSPNFNWNTEPEESL